MPDQSQPNDSNQPKAVNPEPIITGDEYSSVPATPPAQTGTSPTPDIVTPGVVPEVGEGQTPPGVSSPTVDLPPVLTQAPSPKKFGGSRVIATVLGVLLLVGAVGAGVLLVQQQQEIREKAAVIETVPTTTIDGEPVPSPVDVNTIVGNEPERLKPSLVFANAVPIKTDERLQLVLEKDGAEVVDNKGFGSIMVVEMLVDPGTYTLKVNNIGDDSNYFTSTFIVDAETVNILIRTNDGSRQGKFILQRFGHQDFADVKFYNLSDDDKLGVFGGTLTKYNQILGINSGSYRNLDFQTPERITFAINSGLSSLKNRLVDFPNSKKVKIVFFALGSTAQSNLSAVTIPLPEKYQTASLTQKGTHDPTLEWCEGVYTCRLVNKDCSDCGKICLPTPQVCSENSNGGAGEDWNGKKTDKPQK